MEENIKILERARKLMHTRVVVDASVMIKIFFQEEDSALVREIVDLNRKMELSLLSPPLLFFELLNILSNKLKDEAKVQSSLKDLFHFNIGIIDPKYGYLKKAIKNACEFRASYYDSSYHALAKDMDGVFLTADQKYFDMMKAQGNILLLSNL